MNPRRHWRDQAMPNIARTGQPVIVSCRLLVAACLAIATTVSASHAQTPKPTAQETKLVRACVEQKGGTTKDTQCIGQVSSRCQKKPGGGANLNSADCHRIEQDIWEVLLAEHHTALEEDLDVDQKAKLKEMQAAWVKARDTTCDFYDHKIQGSMSVPMTASCYLNETARRALLLLVFSGL
jgi:uncharacterized protein YecT (DUF1311 family)